MTSGNTHTGCVCGCADCMFVQGVAEALGAIHGRAGTTPYGDLDLDDSQLMTVLGETGPTTEDNHPRRLALLQAYQDAWQQAREGTRS